MAYRRLEHFLFRETDPRIYAALRIAFGLLAAATILDLLPLSREHLSDSGWLTCADYRPLLLSAFLVSCGAPAVTLFMLATLAACLAFAAGLFTRISGVLAFFGYMAVISKNPVISYAGDFYIQSTLLYLILAPSGAAWSLDQRFRAARSTGCPAWPLRLIQFQIVLVYFTTGFAKLQGLSWWNGTAIEIVLMDPMYARWDYSFLRNLPAAIQGLRLYGQLILFWEVLFPLLILVRQIRVQVLAVGLSLHLGIILLLHHKWFGYIMLAAYLSFLPNSFVEKAKEALARRRALRAEAAR